MSEVHVSVGPVDASGTKIVFTTPVSIHSGLAAGLAVTTQATGKGQ